MFTVISFPLVNGFDFSLSDQTSFPHMFPVSHWWFATTCSYVNRIAERSTTNANYLLIWCFLKVICCSRFYLEVSAQGIHSIRRRHFYCLLGMPHLFFFIKSNEHSPEKVPPQHYAASIWRDCGFMVMCGVLFSFHVAQKCLYKYNFITFQ